MIGIYFFILLFFGSWLFEKIKANSFNKESKKQSEKENLDIYYDFYGKPWYKDKRCYIGNNNGHHVCMSLNGKTVYRDYTQEKLDKEWKKYYKEYEEEKSKALSMGRNVINIKYPEVGLIKIEISTGKRIKTMAVRGIGTTYYKYYYDSIKDESSWLNNGKEISLEEYKTIS